MRRDDSGGGVRFGYYSDLMFFNGSAWDRYIPSRFDERITYDVIVIGSGMGGGILADAVSDLGLRTLVLEAGPIRHLVNVTDLPVPNVVEAFDPYELEPGTQLKGGVSFNLGGRSIFWSAVIPRLRRWELQYWPDEVARYLLSDLGYARAEQLFRKRAHYPDFQEKLVNQMATAFSGYDVTPLPRSYHQPDSVINPRPGSPDERTTGVFSTAALLADSLVNYPRAAADTLDLAVQHLADRIILDGRNAAGVDVLDLRTGTRRTFRGKTIVLACGTTESARLALTSELLDESNLIGIGLADHPEAEIRFSIPPDSNILSENDQGNIYLRPKEPEGDTSDKFSCELALNHKYWDVRIEDDDLWAAKFAAEQPISSTIKFLFRNPLEEANRLWIDGDRYRIRLDPMKKVMETEVRSLGDEVLNYFGADPSVHSLEYSPYAVTYHLGGSMRMGSAPTRSVVSEDLRFHGYDNLYCCDLSVFPDIPASNPSLTIGALALRLADHLRRQVK